MTKIVIIEDNETIRAELSVFLNRNGYETEAPERFDDVVSMAVAPATDLVLLDINLPVFDGFYVTREIRKLSQVPIIIVTSRDTEIDELVGMNLGADDFVTKPYNTQILLARIRSTLRRSDPSVTGARLPCGRFSLNHARGTLVVGEVEIELTRNELRILGRLCERRGEIVSRSDLMRALWDTDVFVDDNTLTVNINRLRGRLDEVGLTELIETRRGQGYLIGE
ncbi:MAG: response regulator transcription factor [Thermoleophilia bacterium]|nr:response regulator transcription factor [Thermoleophilia bacterium]